MCRRQYSSGGNSQHNNNTHMKRILIAIACAALPALAQDAPAPMPAPQPAPPAMQGPEGAPAPGMMDKSARPKHHGARPGQPGQCPKGMPGKPGPRPEGAPVPPVAPQA